MGVNMVPVNVVREMPWFGGWATERALTPAERELLWLAVGGSAVHAELAAARGVKSSTIKVQVRDLCKKLDVRTLRDAVVMVLREALDVSEAGRAALSGSAGPR